MEEKLQLVQRTLRDLVRFNTDKEDLNLDVAFILASNDDELIDEFRKMYYHRNFKWVNDIDNEIADILFEIYGLYFDETTNQNRALRYAVNQKSPFEDEQDGNAILQPIIFEDGLLTVAKNNQVLQMFLTYHPDNNVLFEEVDTKKDASAQIDWMNIQLDAQLAARTLDLATKEAIGRILLGTRVDRLSSEELNRDILIHARNNPKEFLDMLNDPELRLQNIAAKALQDGFFVLKNNRRDIYFNLPDNKKKLMGIPFGEDTIKLLTSYLQSDDGIDLYKMLEKKYSK